LLLIDGGAGEIVVHPTAQDLQRYRHFQRELARSAEALSRLKHARTLTKDGVEIQLFANAELLNDVAQARACGAVGIGLYRTEFLFLQRHELPDEEEQFTVYRDLVLAMGGAPVTIRTLDLGADKADSTGLALAQEPNPALGVRGVRLALRRPALFATQLRAILRASVFGPVRILVPMITSSEEIVAVRALVKSLARDLRSEGHEIGENYELGAMIEVPAAALSIGGFMDQVDFVSIGTNDLMQYMLAADRDNEAISDLYSPLNPAFLQVLHGILALGIRRGLPVAICGEMAGDMRFTKLLLALGLVDFSLHPTTLLEVRQVIRDSDIGKLRARTRSLLRARDRMGIERWLLES